MRAAKRVDLSDIGNCSMIELLNLSNNMIEEIDITPLSSCNSLTTLLLENNNLTNIDLWPLARTESFKHLNLKNNRLHALDLTPIFLRANVDLDSSVVISADYILRYALSSKQLEKRFLLVRPDRAPWTATPVIIWNRYETLARKCDWSEIHERITLIIDQVEKRDWFAIQRGLLMGLSLDGLAGYDGNPRDLLASTSSDMDYKTARQMIFDITIELLDSQVEAGGSTLFLDTESMKTTKASKLIPKIIEARRLEMERVIVQTKGSIALMNSLWLSHYGFKILRALEVGAQHYGEGLDRVRASLDELGFDLNIEKVSSITESQIVDPIIASESLKRYVSHLIENAYS